MRNNELFDLKPGYSRRPSAGWRGRVEFWIGQALGKGQAARWAVQVDRWLIHEQGKPELGWIGRTWISRGRAYWIRRVSAAVVNFLLFYVGGGFYVSELFLLWQARWPLWVRGTLTVPLVIAAIVMFVRMWRKLDIVGFRPLTGGRWSPSLSFSAMRVLGPILLPIATPMLGGLTAAMFLTTLRRDFPGEKVARAALIEYEGLHEKRKATRRSKK